VKRQAHIEEESTDGLPQSAVPELLEAFRAGDGEDSALQVLNNIQLRSKDR
jgi:hypothetical protein